MIHVGRLLTFPLLITLGFAPAAPLARADERSEARKAATLNFRNDWIKSERALISSIDPFPSKEVPPFDPITKKKAAHTLVGPAFRSWTYSDYDYYRYVTYYDVKIRKEQIYELPVTRAQCWDRSELFASYSYTTSYTASVTASASFEGIGLSASFTASRTFSTGRQIPATAGFVADYTPYALKQDWVGRTFIQLYDTKTGKMKFLEKPTEESPWWVFAFFPLASQEEYPMRFQVKDAFWTFSVEREILEACK